MPPLPQLPQLPDNLSNLPPVDSGIPLPVLVGQVVSDVPPIKPGTKTTEFWLTAAASALTTIGAFVLFICHRIDQGAFVTLAASGGAGLPAVYAIVRSWLKNMNINVDYAPGSSPPPQ